MTRARAIGVVTVVLVVLTALVTAGRHDLALPLTLDLRGLGTTGIGGRTALGDVGRVALLIPAALAGLGLLVAGGRGMGRRTLLVLVGLASPIAVFLVAQLNGVSDAGALLLIYAGTASGLLVRGLQDRDRGARPAELPLWLATAIGVVPWGAIALNQVGALLVGTPPTPVVQVLTIAVLAATVVELVVSWRGRRRSAAPSALEAALVVVPPLLLAGLGILVRS